MTEKDQDINMEMIPLLMTASVSTRGMVGGAFSDRERENMYLLTLKFYESSILSSPQQKIVFVDNSGWDLSYIKKNITSRFVDQIEFISLNKNKFDIGKGKGYNELLLINKAIEKSKFIREVGAFFKVTGRYPILNLKYYLKSASKSIFVKGLFFCGDMKDHPIYDILHTGWNGHSAESRLFACEVNWYKQNIGVRYIELNDYGKDKKILEALLYEVMKSNDNISKRFKREPHMGGLEGSSGNAVFFSKDQNSLLNRLKRYFGNFIRIFLPFIWF